MFPVNLNKEHPCHYCLKIPESGYPLRAGVFTVDNFVRRCPLHSQFCCSTCGLYRHFSALFWCQEHRSTTCIYCHEYTVTPVRFWGRTYAFTIECHYCEGVHHDLFYSEFQGVHPLQLGSQIDCVIREGDDIWVPQEFREGEVISFEEARVSPNSALQLVKMQGADGIHSEVIPEDEVDYMETVENWEATSQEWIEILRQQNEERDDGDISRQLVIDSSLWEMIGDVRGLSVLDAGCGNGYFVRKLARRGARAVGVDHTDSFIRHCRAIEKENPLGCEYHRADLADLGLFPSESFDLVVANVVFVDVKDYRGAFREIRRVLKPGGRFIWSNLHPVFSCFGSATLRFPFDSPRKEDRLGKLIDRYFDSGAMLVSWGRIKPIWQFSRTLSEYSRGLKDAGMVISEICEPRPDDDTLRAHPRLLFDSDRYPDFIIFECVVL